MEQERINLQAYAHAYAREVYLYETDAFGHANNVSFIAYMESARFDLFKELELFDPRDVFTLPLILVRIECDYKEISRYNDLLTIYTGVSEIGASSFTLQHAIVREDDGVVVATGHAVLVVFDHETNLPVPIPDDVRDKLEAYRLRDE
jgi:acyl-CoA thioester hydrolase